LGGIPLGSHPEDINCLVVSTYPSEKYESLGMMIIPNKNGKIKHVPKLQPGFV